MPLTKLPASEARNSAARAMSSGKPARGIGCAWANRLVTVARWRSATLLSMPMPLAKTPVTIAPGEMLFTRTLLSPSSAATANRHQRAEPGGEADGR